VFQDTPQTRILHRALDVCGGELALAEALEVPVEVLSRWLSGDEATPAKIYMEALDLVSVGRFAHHGPPH
jgi:hypothetical protein